MDIGLEFVLAYIDVFLLTFVRVTAIFILSPIFGSRNLPHIFKMSLALIIALIIAPMIGPETQIEYNGWLQYASVIFIEFLVGLILGFVCYMAFLSLYLAGQIIDMQVGFGMVNVIDPQSNMQVPVVANLYNIIALLMLFSINGHHMIISSLFYSYKILPIGTAVITEVLVVDVVRMFGEMFSIAFKITAPIIAAIFITNVALGILAKTVPQMNVFMVGMPLKIIIGLLTLILVIPMFSVVMDNIVNGMFHDIGTVLKDMIRR